MFCLQILPPSILQIALEVGLETVTQNQQYTWIQGTNYQEMLYWGSSDHLPVLGPSSASALTSDHAQIWSPVIWQKIGHISKTPALENATNSSLVYSLKEICMIYICEEYIYICMHKTCRKLGELYLVALLKVCCYFWIFTNFLSHRLLLLVVQCLKSSQR